MKNSSKPCFDEKGGAAQKANIYPQNKLHLFFRFTVAFFAFRKIQFCEFNLYFLFFCGAVLVRSPGLANSENKV